MTKEFFSFLSSGLCQNPAVGGLLKDRLDKLRRWRKSLRLQSNLQERTHSNPLRAFFYSPYQRGATRISILQEYSAVCGLAAYDIAQRGGGDTKIYKRQHNIIIMIYDTKRVTLLSKVSYSIRFRLSAALSRRMKLTRGNFGIRGLAFRLGGGRRKWRRLNPRPQGPRRNISHETPPEMFRIGLTSGLLMVYFPHKEF